MRQTRTVFAIVLVLLALVYHVRAQSTKSTVNLAFENQLPAWLNETNWDTSIDESKFAVAHNGEGKPYDIHKNTTANAADLLLTTIDDYSKFAINVLNRKGLSQAVFDDIVRPQVRYPSGKNMFFGLGWMVMPDLSNGEYALIHTGSDPGVSTVVILFPKSQRSLIVFTNGDNGVRVWTRILAEAFEVGTEMLQRA